MSSGTPTTLKPDARAYLAAVASGRKPESGGSTVDPAFAAKHQAAFAAWHSFVADAHRDGSRGEPLHAPAEILTPLP